MKTRFTVAFIAALSAFAAHSTLAASADGVAQIKVEAQLSATASRALEFGTVTQGDAAATVDAADASNSAAFAVTGEPSKSYAISLPSSPIVMKKGGGGTSTTEIEVSDFTSNKTNDIGTIDGSGTDSFQVGGTHAAILNNQESGDYTGTFTVNVVYQ